MMSLAVVKDDSGALTSLLYQVQALVDATCIQLNEQEHLDLEEVVEVDEPRAHKKQKETYRQQRAAQYVPAFRCVCAAHTYSVCAFEFADSVGSTFFLEPRGN